MSGGPLDLYESRPRTISSVGLAAADASQRIVTHEQESAQAIARFHDSREMPEGLFGEAKTHARRDHVP